MEENEALDSRVRDAVYASIVAHGRPPTVAEVAGEMTIGPDDVRAACERLNERHAIFLTPGTHEIRMAHPFSGVPTPFRVTVAERAYWANCACDALGIPAALHADARIDAETVDHEPLQIVVVSGRLQGWGGVVHFPLPFRRWYDDLIHT